MICITNIVVKVDPSAKNVLEKPLHRRRSVNTRTAIVNRPFECTHPAPTASIQSQNTTSSNQMDNNNLYQGLIQKNNKILIIRTLRPSKDHQTFIEQQPDPSPNEKKDNNIFLIPGNYQRVQHITPINKSGIHEMFLMVQIKEDEFKLLLRKPL